MSTYYDFNAAENIKKNTSNAQEAFQTPIGAIPAFLEKLQEWKFSPPHNNLWTVEIGLHNDGGEGQHNLLTLYKNIDQANSRSKQVISSSWDVKNSSQSDYMNDFLNRLQGTKNAFFLAQGVSFDPQQATVEQLGSDMGDHKGFIRMGMIEKGIPSSFQVRMQFLETNWSLSDILFDKWIAAVTQQGLIEDSSLPSIKADIKINEYSGSIPASTVNKKSDNTKEWQLRRITTIYQAVPLNRDQLELNYDAPQWKTTSVTFSFQDYAIEYVI